MYSLHKLKLTEITYNTSLNTHISKTQFFFFLCVLQFHKIKTIGTYIFNKIIGNTFYKIFTY